MGYSGILNYPSLDLLDYKKHLLRNLIALNCLFPIANPLILITHTNGNKTILDNEPLKYWNW